VFVGCCSSLSIVISSTSLGGCSTSPGGFSTMLSSDGCTLLSNDGSVSDAGKIEFFCIVIWLIDAYKSSEKNIIFKTKSMSIYRYEILNRTVCICGLIE